jgi:hypothetical protein
MLSSPLRRGFAGHDSSQQEKTNRNRPVQARRSRKIPTRGGNHSLLKSFELRSHHGHRCYAMTLQHSPIPGKTNEKIRIPAVILST